MDREKAYAAYKRGGVEGIVKELGYAKSTAQCFASQQGFKARLRDELANPPLEDGSPQAVSVAAIKLLAACEGDEKRAIKAIKALVNM